MVASSSSRENPPMDYTRVQNVGRYNRLKVSYFSNYPEHSPNSYMIDKVKRSGNFTFYSASDVDPLTFDSSIDYNPPPKANLHSKRDKQETTNMHIIFKSWVTCYNKA
jgi:hypothetical protein